MIHPLLERLGLRHPIIQAPMAGTSTPVMAAAVSNAGALGSIGIGAADFATARSMIEETHALTDHSFNVNAFTHQRPIPDLVREAAWVEKLRPYFIEFGAEPPTQLNTIYTSFCDDAAMQELLLELRPPVVSFHFGLPDQSVINALKKTGTILFATATNLEESRAIERAGLDAIVAQGVEAGGHRGIFDLNKPDEALPTLKLVRLLAASTKLPVIAAGGIMDGAQIRAALDAGAIAAQLGTAFIACPESSADDAHRKLLMGDGAKQTQLVRHISGRPARSLPTRFTALADGLSWAEIPDYPRCYDGGKALHVAAKAKGDFGFGPYWAGTGAPEARAMAAADLIATLAQELAATK